MRDEKGRFIKGHAYPGIAKPNSGSFKKGQTVGEKNNKWKDNKVGYRAIHTWIERQLGKASYCSFNPNHQATRFHWANISGAYLRDINDYSSLCAKCHKQYDRIRSGKAYV